MLEARWLIQRSEQLMRHGQDRKFSKEALHGKALLVLSGDSLVMPTSKTTKRKTT